MALALLTTTPKPSLALAVKDARVTRRAEKRAANPIRRWLRRIAVGFAVAFALLSFSGGTAQAWPWDVQDDITAFITNFCGPQDVPALADYTGVDTTLGLNNVKNSTVRTTIVGDSDAIAGQAGNGGNGLARLQVAFGNNDILAKPTYERYGYSSLHWTNFGSGCFSIGYWFSPISNLAYTLAVKLPMIVSMSVLHLAMDNVLYDVFTTIISPFVKVFNAIFTPWIFFIAPIGVAWVWIKSKGSTQQVMKAAVWVLCIYGVFAWMGNNTSTLVTKANNFVTVFAGGAAAKISETATGTASDPANPLGAIDQALWHGVPYQTWLVGEVGDSQAGADQALEKEGKLGWGPAILNGLYIGNDGDAAKGLEQRRQEWNNRSYAPHDGEGKTNAWTTDGGKKSWNGIPLLTTVKFMCNDTAKGSGNSGDEKDNKWFYGGNCDAAGAGTTGMVAHFTGSTYNEQLIAAFAGGWATLAVTLTISLASIYLALQKMMFYFLLLFGPIFLAVSTFADEKRRAFAKRYFELLIANVIKQCVAVCVVLFVSFSMSNLLYPPADLGVPTIPWMLKPAVAMLFFIAMVLFLIPLRNILAAAAKGDTKIVDKVAQAPVEAAKTAGKVALVAGAAAATGGIALAAGGTSLGAAAMASGNVGKAGQVLTTASRMVGARGGVGKALRAAGQGANLAQQVGSSQLDKQGRAEGILAGAKGLISANPGKYEVGKDGQPTSAGLAAAKKDFMKDVQSGTVAARADRAFATTQAAGFAGHLKRTGEHHAMDPKNPENLKAAALAKENERLDTQEQAKNARARDVNGAAVGVEAGAMAANGDHVQARMAKQAQDLMDQPKFARNPDIQANVTTAGADVLTGMNVTQGQAAANPGMLLTGQAYNGGDTTAMDPRHPTTAALTELKFAAVNGTEQDKQIALMKASAAVGTHGVPDEVTAIRTVADTGTAAGFQSVSVVGAMTPLNPQTTWQGRAQSAVTMQAAVAQMPADHPASESMQTYVKALADPMVPGVEVEALRAQAINGVAAASAGLTPTAYTAFAAYELAKADPTKTTADLQPLEKQAMEAVLASPTQNVKYADDSAEQVFTWARSTADRYAVTPDPVNEPALFAAPPSMVAGAAARQMEAEQGRAAERAVAAQQREATSTEDPNQPWLPVEAQAGLFAAPPSHVAGAAPRQTEAAPTEDPNQPSLPIEAQGMLFAPESQTPTGRHSAPVAAEPVTPQPAATGPSDDQPALFSVGPTASQAPASAPAQQPLFPDEPTQAPTAAAAGPAAAPVTPSVVSQPEPVNEPQPAAPAQPEVFQPALFDMPAQQQADPVRPEPVRPEPVSAPADFGPSEPSRSETFAAAPVVGAGSVEAVPAEPFQQERAQAESQPEPTRSEPGQQERGYSSSPAPVEPVAARESSRTFDEPVSAEPVTQGPVEPSVGSSRLFGAEPVRAEEVQPEQVRPEPTRPEPTYNEPVTSESLRSEPVHAEPAARSEAPDYNEPVVTPAAPAASSERSAAPVQPVEDRSPVFDQPQAAPAAPAADTGGSAPPVVPAATFVAAAAADRQDEVRRDDTPRYDGPAERDRYAASAPVPAAQGWDLDGYGPGRTTAAPDGDRRAEDARQDRPYRDDERSAEAASYSDRVPDDRRYDDRADDRGYPDRGQPDRQVTEVHYVPEPAVGSQNQGIDRDALREALRETRNEDRYLRPEQVAPAESDRTAGPDGAQVAERVAARQMRSNAAPDAAGGPVETGDAPVDSGEAEHDDGRRTFRPSKRKRNTGLFGGPTEPDDENDKEGR